MSVRSRNKKQEKLARQSLLPRLDSRIESRRKELLWLFLAVNALLCLVLFDPKLHTGGDNAAYMILAESIVRPDVGYTDFYISGPPKPHDHYPFGYPLLLAPLLAIFGKNFLIFKFLSSALAIGSVALFSSIAHRRFRPSVWAALCLSFALNPLIVEYAHWILSEVPFLFFSLLGLELIEESQEESNGKYGVKFWLALLAMAMAAHIRSIGLAFLFAGFAYFAVRKQWRKCIVFTVVMLCMILPWVVRNQMVAEDQSVYVSQILQKNVYNLDQGAVGVAGMVSRVADNIRIYAGREMGRVLFRVDDVLAAGQAYTLMNWLISLVMLAGFIPALIRRRGLLEFYTLVYLGGILIFPEVASDVRYLLPLAPMLLVYLIEGIGILNTGLKIAGDKPVLFEVVVLAVAAIIGTGTQVTQIPSNLKNLQAYIRGDRYAGYSSNWRDFFEAADWARNNTPENAVFTVRKPTHFYLCSGRKVLLYPYTTNTVEVLDVVFASDYVVIDAVSGTTQRFLIPALSKHPEKFRLVFDRPYAKVAEVLK